MAQYIAKVRISPQHVVGVNCFRHQIFKTSKSGKLQENDLCAIEMKMRRSAYPAFLLGRRRLSCEPVRVRETQHAISNRTA